MSVLTFCEAFQCNHPLDTSLQSHNYPTHLSSREHRASTSTFSYFTMASIDALSGGSNKPDFGLNENDFITLKSVKEVATLDDQRWKNLLQAVHSFVGSHLDECAFTPRTLKKGPYSKLLGLFMINGGSQLWDAHREGHQRGDHFVWPQDQER